MRNILLKKFQQLQRKTSMKENRQLIDPPVISANRLLITSTVIPAEVPTSWIPLKHGRIFLLYLGFLKWFDISFDCLWQLLHKFEPSYCFFTQVFNNALLFVVVPQMFNLMNHPSLRVWMVQLIGDSPFVWVLLNRIVNSDCLLHYWVSDPLPVLPRLNSSFLD